MKPIRVALSGSGFKFPAHVGALAAIEDNGYNVVEIAGTSGGSIVAALYASGVSVHRLKIIALGNDWSNFLTFNPWSLLTKMGYCDGKVLSDWLDLMMPSKTFSSTRIPLSIIASDLTANIPFTFNIENTPMARLSQAARASSAIPMVYAPVQYGSALCFDGGMVNNIPIDKLVVDSIPRLGIQLISKESTLKTGEYTFLSILPRVIELMLSSNENTHVDLGLLSGAKVSFIETGFVDSLDTCMTPHERELLYDAGYAGATKTLKEM